MLQRLPLRIKTWKRRQQGRVNVQDAARKRAYKVGGKQPHEPRETDQVHLVSH
jgi:hypothetical protein